jgi:hypothetical protein
MSDQSLRDHLLELLRGGSAHLRFDEAIEGLPADLRGKKHSELPHTPWQLLEHLRIAQWDILDFSRNPDYVHIKWPDGYWPETAAPPDDAAWDRSVEDFRRDLKAMQDLVADPKTDLYAKIPWGKDQTILREALLIADHNAYHIGQLVTLRQALGAWQPAALP